MNSSKITEKVWLDKPKYDLAEKLYYEKLAKLAEESQSESKKKSIPMQNAITPEEKVLEEIPISNTIPSDPTVKDPVVLDKKKKSDNSNVTKVQTEETVSPQVKALKLQKGLQNSKKAPKPVPGRGPALCIPRSPAPTNPIPPVIFEVKEPQRDLVSTADTQDLSETPLITDIELTSKADPKKMKKIKSKERKKNSKKAASAQGVISIADEVAKARDHIRHSMQSIDNLSSLTSSLSSNGCGSNLIQQLLKDQNASIKKITEMEEKISKLESRLAQVEKEQATKKPAASVSHAPQPKPPQAPRPQDDDADDGVDLFASDSEEEDTEAARVKQQRLAEYAAKKSKSNNPLPWDDETNMKDMESKVREIKLDGLVWGASKLVPLAYGIHKLQISCVVEDEKVSVDLLQETIQDIEDFVQSVDIAAFNKV